MSRPARGEWIEMIKYCYGDEIVTVSPREGRVD